MASFSPKRAGDRLGSDLAHPVVFALFDLGRLCNVNIPAECGLLGFPTVFDRSEPGDLIRLYLRRQVLPFPAGLTA